MMTNLVLITNYSELKHQFIEIYILRIFKNISKQFEEQSKKQNTKIFSEAERKVMYYGKKILTIYEGR